MVYNSTSSESILCNTPSFTIEPSVLSKTSVNQTVQQVTNQGKIESVNVSPLSGGLADDRRTHQTTTFGGNQYGSPLSSVSHGAYSPNPPYAYSASFLTPLSYGDCQQSVGYEEFVDIPEPLCQPPPVPSLLEPGLPNLYSNEFELLTEEFGRPQTQLPIANAQVQRQPKRQASPPAEPPPSKFDTAVASLVDSQGGLLRSDMVPKLQQLMKEETSLKNQSLLLTVLQASRVMFQQKFVNSGGLDICNSWLDNKRLAPLVLKVLFKLPVDLNALKTNGKIGRTVRKLSNNPDAKIQAVAKKVLAKWKQTVERASVSKAPPSTKPSGNAPSGANSLAGSKRAQNPNANDSGLKSASPLKKTKPNPPAMTPLDVFGSSGAPVAPQKVMKKKPVRVKSAAPSSKIKLLGDSDSQKTEGKDSLMRDIHSAPLSVDDIKRKKLEQQHLQSLQQRNIQKNSSSSSSGLKSSPSSSIDVDSPIPLKNESSFTNDSIIIKEEERGEDGEPLIPFGPPRKPKKNVSWPPDSQLVRVKKFPRDKSLSHRKPMVQLPSKQQMLNPHYRPQNQPPQTGGPPIGEIFSALQSPARQEPPRKDPLTVKMVPSISWYRPATCDIPEEFCIARGEESKQAAIQAERDRGVLSAVFLPDRIPPSPLEWDPKQSDSHSDIDGVEVDDDDSLIVEIPLHDVTKGDSQLNSAENLNHLSSSVQMNHSSPTAPMVPGTSFSSAPMMGGLFSSHSQGGNFHQGGNYSSQTGQNLNSANFGYSHSTVGQIAQSNVNANAPPSMGMGSPVQNVSLGNQLPAQFQDLLQSLSSSNIDPQLLMELKTNPTRDVINRVINWLTTHGGQQQAPSSGGQYYPPPQNTSGNYSQQQPSYHYPSSQTQQQPSYHHQQNANTFHQPPHRYPATGNTNSYQYSQSGGRNYY